MTDNRLPGILLKISMGNCRPASAMCPFSTAGGQFSDGRWPADRIYILGHVSIAADRRDVGCSVGGTPEVSGVSSSAITGVFTGRMDTAVARVAGDFSLAVKVRLVDCAIICIILRAVCFGFLSSFSNAPST